MTIDKAIELVKSKLEGKQYGDEYVVKTCPYCGRSDGKFYINTETTKFNCKHASCGEKGNIITLFQKLGIKETVEFDGFVSKKAKKEQSVVLDYNDLIELDKNNHMVSYMKSRGISYETLTGANVMYSKSKRSLAFIAKRYYGKDVACSFRGENKLIFQAPHSQQVLWGAENLNYRNNTIYITEGRVDALSLMEMGIENVLSMPMGCSSHGWIDKDWDLLHNFKKIVLCFDNDEPGHKGLEQVKTRLDFAQIFTLEYGDYKDINEMFMDDMESLYSAIRAPRELIIDGFISLQNVKTNTNPLGQLSSCGLQQFDRMFGGFGLYQSTIICSPSGVGKTTVVCNMMKGFISVNEKVAIWSGELSNPKLKTWLYAAIAGERALDSVDNPYRPGEKLYSVKPDYEERIDRAVDGKLYVYDGNQNNGFKMLEHFEMLNKRHGVKYFFIDNLSILNMSVKGVGKYEGEEEFSKALASFTRNNAVHVFIIMHPIKANINSEIDYIKKDGTVKTPERYDQYSVKGSSSIVNLAHNIMFLQKATEHHMAYYVQKVEKAGASELVQSIINELSLIAYLVKARETGITNEDTLFGYSHETRRIYGLKSKAEDLGKEILDDIEEYDSNEFIDLDEF